MLPAVSVILKTVRCRAQTVEFQLRRSRSLCCRRNSAMNFTVAAESKPHINKRFWGAPANMAQATRNQIAHHWGYAYLPATASPRRLTRCDIRKLWSLESQSGHSARYVCRCYRPRNARLIRCILGTSFHRPPARPHREQPRQFRFLTDAEPGITVGFGASGGRGKVTRIIQAFRCHPRGAGCRVSWGHQSLMLDPGFCRCLDYGPLDRGCFAKLNSDVRSSRLLVGTEIYDCGSMEYSGGILNAFSLRGSYNWVEWPLGASVWNTCCSGRGASWDSTQVLAMGCQYHAHRSMA